VDDVKTRTRRQILDVAADLLEREGAQAVSTRSVAAAAGIRAASLYQLFGDKDGLLTALAIHAFETYLTEKQALAHTDDPVADLARGWDAHVDFGLRHPAFYLLMYGTDRPGRRPPAAEEAHRLLMAFLDRTAAAGRLRVPPAEAARLLLAAATGVTFTLIGTPAEDRDPQTSPRMRDAVIATLTTDAAAEAGTGAGRRTAKDTAAGPAAPTPLAPKALALDAELARADADDLPLRPTETALLRDWLHRLAR
jgi:AcrR family transcriptional regulator